VSSRRAKNPLAPTGKSPLGPRAIPHPKRGAYRDRHGRWARDAMDEGSRGRRARDLRTAKSCGPDAPMLASSWRRLLRQSWPVTVTTRPVHRGEHEINRNTIVQGMPDRFRRACGDYTRMLSILHTRLRVRRAPGIPCALSFEGREFISPGRLRAAGMHDRVWNRDVDAKTLVTPGLRSGHPSRSQEHFRRRMDGRVKPGHDERGEAHSRDLSLALTGLNQRRKSEPIMR
jgi:hypothetical protein